MLFQPFYLGCLSHGSYLLGSEGQGIVIDPQRDVDQYLQAAEAAGLTITHVVETHLHADFVSGHQELAARTGAQIVVGRRAEVAYPALKVADGDELSIGRLTVRILETPGHTPEGISLLVSDPDQPEEPARLFTGDTLFIGDVGRPDLVGSKGFSAEEMAGMLYDSLHDKILTLPDDVVIFPAHGAGSACGRQISDERSSTLGLQRRLNYALQPMPREAFISLMTTNLPPAPAYFTHNADLNRQGAPALTDLPALQAMSAAEAKAAIDGGALVLDLREQAAYAGSHLLGAVQLGLDGRFASWVGSLIPFGSRLILVAEDQAKLSEAQLRLARVGYDQVLGHLPIDPAGWEAAGLSVQQTVNLSPAEGQARLESGWQLLDVRQPREYDEAHVAGAVHVPVDRLATDRLSLDTQKPILVICGSGYRSSAALGLLESRGFRQLASVTGGMAAWQEAKLPVVNPAAIG